MVRYCRGTASFVGVGYPGYELGNLDPRSRVPSTTSGCMVSGFEIFTHAPNNAAITMMATLFGPMPGAYHGPYPDREQAREALRRSKDTVYANLFGGGFGPVKDCAALRDVAGLQGDHPTARCALFESSTLLLGYEDRIVLVDRDTGRSYAHYRVR
jgi:hypothetical protein